MNVAVGSRPVQSFKPVSSETNHQLSVGLSGPVPPIRATIRGIHHWAVSLEVVCECSRLRDIRSPGKWYFPSNPRHQFAIDLGNCDFRLGALVPQVGEHDTPGIDNHAMSVSNPFIVVSSYLCGGNDVGLRFNGSSSEEYLPMSLSCRDGKSRGERNDVGSLALERETNLWEP